MLLGALAVYVWIAGLQMHHAYAGATACRPISSPACGNLFLNVNQMNTILANGYVLQAVPALIGMFVGAPMLAREMETGTFRYAWTQGFGRWRWALAKLVLLGVALAAAVGALSALLSWYYEPYFAARDPAMSFSEMSPLTPGLFPLRGFAFAAWTLAAIAIAGLAGMLLRRVVPTIVATLAAYTALAVAAGGVPAPALPAAERHQQSEPAGCRLDHEPMVDQGRFAFAGPRRPGHPPLSAALPHWQVVARPRALLCPARLHAMDQLPAGQPVLAIPVHRGRLATRAVRAADRRGDGLAVRRRAACRIRRRAPKSRPPYFDQLAVMPADRCIASVVGKRHARYHHVPPRHVSLMHSRCGRHARDRRSRLRLGSEAFVRGLGFEVAMRSGGVG